MTNLSSKALAVCEANYGANCGRCPLRPACVVQVGPGWDAYRRWIDGVNQAAEEITAGRRG